MLVDDPIQNPTEPRGGLDSEIQAEAPDPGAATLPGGNPPPETARSPIASARPNGATKLFRINKKTPEKIKNEAKRSQTVATSLDFR